jgi:hypothetical protein
MIPYDNSNYFPGDVHAFYLIAFVVLLCPFDPIMLRLSMKINGFY